MDAPVCRLAPEQTAHEWGALLNLSGTRAASRTPQHHSPGQQAGAWAQGGPNSSAVSHRRHVAVPVGFCKSPRVVVLNVGAARVWRVTAALGAPRERDTTRRRQAPRGPPVLRTLHSSVRTAAQARDHGNHCLAPQICGFRDVA
ncbi:unnamed protein product [Lampetra fluviatilis]